MKTLKAAISLLVLSCISAIAADLPSIKLAPVATPAPVWTGFYAGLNAGGTWGNNNSTKESTWPLANGGLIYWATLNGKVSSANANGFIGGGQVGYNWQIPFQNINILAGVEADIQGISSDGGVRTTNADWQLQQLGCCNVLNSTRVSTSMHWIGTVRGRLGYLVTPNLLLYGTGGLAYGTFNFNIRKTQLDSFVFPADYGACPGFSGYSCNGITPIAIAVGSANSSSNLVGYSVGGGAEWMLFRDWSLKAEYLYYNLGDVVTTTFLKNYPLGYSAASGVRYDRPFAESNSRTSVNGNIVRAGVNYHFNFENIASVVTKF
jgi:outer membrane immunogenic protein